MRRVTKETIRLTAAFLATSVATACGAGPQATGVFRTHASQDQLFNAAKAAVPAIGYRITTVSRVEGLITAEQNVVMGHGTAVGLNASISSDGGDRLLQVSFAAPPGSFALGDFNQNVTEYIRIVQTRVPDLHASAY